MKDHRLNHDKDKAFQSLFRSFFPALYTFTLHLVKEPENAKDITQETFLRIYQKWDVYGLSNDHKAFLYTTAKNLCIDHFRKAKTIHSYEMGNKPAEYIEDNYLNELTKQESIRILYQAIKELPIQSREVIKHSLTGKNNNEIVDVMGISLNTVKTHKKTAYRILREKLLPDIFILLLLISVFE